MEWATTSEVLMTAISTKGMIEVVQAHGLEPVAVDVSAHSLAPSKDDILAKITPKTKAIVISYPYGKRFPILDLVKFCKGHGLYVIEDSSEFFPSLQNPGCSQADLTLISMGMIKHNTAFGGSLTIVRGKTDELFQRMKLAENSFDRERAFNYYTRVMKAI